MIAWGAQSADHPDQFGQPGPVPAPEHGALSTIPGRNVRFCTAMGGDYLAKTAVTGQQSGELIPCRVF